MDRPENRRGAYALSAGEGWTYRFGIDFCVKAGETARGNGAAVVEYVTKQGEEPADHVHETEDEMFYVLQGSLTFRCGQQVFDVEIGGFVFLPRGARHGYTVRSAHPVRLLVITAPGTAEHRRGWGGFVADMETGQGELVGEPPPG